MMDMPAMPRCDRLVVVVLGDLGRSPRMLNHAWAAAEAGKEVVLVGYAETAVDADVAGHPGIEIRPLHAAGRAGEDRSRLFILLYSVWKGCVLSVRLAGALLAGPRPNEVLVQNPPSLPTLPIAWAAARARGAGLVVDWHNFGHAMLALRLGRGSVAVALFRRLEYFFARRADGHLCVSGAMAERLSAEAGVRAEVVYDRPRKLDELLSREERQEIQCELFPGERSALVHCPTSWTADEDIDLLLDALELRETTAAEDGVPLEVVITGRGPLQQHYEARIAGLELRRTRVRTAFLTPESYRRLLRAADIGLSLHTSASGVDLPMKIVDFFGARTPVLAYRYGPTLDEQVAEGRTGWTFRTAAELAALLERTDYEAARPVVAETWGRTFGESLREQRLRGCERMESVR